MVKLQQNPPSGNANFSIQLRNLINYLMKLIPKLGRGLRWSHYSSIAPIPIRYESENGMGMEAYFKYGIRMDVIF